MSAARNLLTTLLAVLLLAACDDFHKEPQPPGGDPPVEDEEPLIEPEVIWEHDFDENRDIHRTFFVVSDGGTPYLTTNEHGTLGAKTAVIVLDPRTGLEKHRASLLAEGASVEVRGIVPAAGDSAIAFGRYTQSGQALRSFAHRVMKDGTLPWGDRLLLEVPGHSLDVLGGTPAPDGGALLFGRLFNTTTKAEELWLAHVSPAGTIERTTRHAVDGQTIVAGAYTPTSPFPGEAMGALYLLRQVQSCADPAVSDPLDCGQVLHQAIIELVNVDDLSIATTLDGIRDPSPNEYYTDITATAAGDVYLVGWHESEERMPDVLAFKYDKARGRLLWNTFGGMADDRAYYAATAAGDTLLVGGTSLAAMGGKAGRWPKQTGDGRAFIAVIAPDLTLNWVHMPGNFDDTWILRGIAHHPDYGYFLAGVNKRGEHFITRLERPED